VCAEARSRASTFSSAQAWHGLNGYARYSDALARPAGHKDVGRTEGAAGPARDQTAHTAGAESAAACEAAAPHLHTPGGEEVPEAQWTSAAAGGGRKSVVEAARERLRSRGRRRGSVLRSSVIHNAGRRAMRSRRSRLGRGADP